MSTRQFVLVRPVVALLLSCRADTSVCPYVFIVLVISTAWEISRYGFARSLVASLCRDDSIAVCVRSFCCIVVVLSGRHIGLPLQRVFLLLRHRASLVPPPQYLLDCKSKGTRCVTI